MNPIENILNEMVAAKLPAIITGIKEAVISSHIDAWGEVVQFKESIENPIIGMKPIKIFYAIKQMEGLSGISINAITFDSLQTNPDNANEIKGTISISAGVPENVTAGIFGELVDNSGFLPQYEPITGSVALPKLRVAASGTFSATNNNGNVCLTSVIIDDIQVGYKDIDTDINNLGAFNMLLSSVMKSITNLLKGPAINAIGNALRPVLNSEINKILPLCKNI